MDESQRERHRAARAAVEHRRWKWLAALTLGLSLQAELSALPLKYFLSERPLQDAAELTEPPPLTQPHRTQTGPPWIPLLGWGLRFDEDLMVSLEGDSPWGMVEVGKLSLPDETELWFTLDSYEDGRQVVGLPDDPRARTLAPFFPAPSQPGDLEVKERPGSRAGETSFEASYTRLDGSEVRFTMEAPDASRPPKKRNGNAMNHSEARALALLDLESLWLRAPQDSSLQVQRILGQPVAGRMRQTVGGLQSGRWRQEGLTLYPEGEGAYPLPLRWQRSGEEEWLETDSSFHRVRWVFQRREGHSELARLEVHQPRQEGDPPILTMRFSPPLPDLRGGSRAESLESEHRMSLWFGEALHQQAALSVEAADSGWRLELRPESPSWAAERPVITYLRPGPEGLEIDSFVMTPGSRSWREMLWEVEETTESVLALRGVWWRWAKRPHRVSGIRVMPAWREEAHRLSLGGGTWANGDTAADWIAAELALAELRGAEFSRLETVELPLLQPLGLEGQRAEGSCQLELRLPEGWADRDVQAWINGFEMQPGPLHQRDGMTLRGMELTLESVQREGRTLRLTVRAAQDFGAVPERRQELRLYSASARVQLGLAALPSEATWTESRVESEQVAETRQQTRASGLSPVSWADPGLLQSLRWEVLDEGADPGRYLRELRLGSGVSSETDGFSNQGAMPRPTAVRWTKTTLWSEALSWEPGPLVRERGGAQPGEGSPAPDLD